jgi:hypothetical protein
MSGYLKSKKFLSVVALIVLLFIIIPLIVVFVAHPSKQNVQGGNNKTATLAANSELATFNGTPIYVSDLNALAMEQYRTDEAKNLTANDLNILLKVYVERKILDKQNLGDVSAQTAQIEKTMGLTGNAAKYEALREKLDTTSAKSWNVYSIDFWLSPIDDLNQATPARQQLSADVDKALDYAQIQMQKGTSVYNVALQISKNYPSLKDIIGVNALKFDASLSPASWNTSAVYYYDKTNAEDPFYKTLYAMTETSPVTKVLNNGNMGGSTIKMVKVNNPSTTSGSYQDLLKSQESSLIIINDALKKINNTK